MPFLVSFALEHEIVTFAWIDNAFPQVPLNIYATKGLIWRIPAEPINEPFQIRRQTHRVPSHVASPFIELPYSF